MTAYRIKHKPTGLYLKPVTGSYGGKTNLSKNGKVYFTEPTGNNLTKWWGGSIKVNEKQCEKYGLDGKRYSYDPKTVYVPVTLDVLEAEKL